jgi:hypothetical protein
MLAAAKCFQMFSWLSLSTVFILSGCFSEVTLPECSNDSECVNAGYCRCEDGYCFHCPAEPVGSICGGIESESCTVFSGNLDGYQWALPPVVDGDDRVWIAWESIEGKQLTLIDADGSTKQHTIPDQLGTPFAAVVADNGTLVLAGDGLYAHPADDTQGVIWSPDSANVVSWPVEVSALSSDGWLVVDSQARLHRVVFGSDEAQSEVVVESLPLNAATTEPIHTLLLRERYLVLAPSAGGVAIVDVDEGTVSTSPRALGARAVSRVGSYAVVCTADSRLVLIDIQDGELVEKEYPLASSCNGIVGNDSHLIISGSDQMQGFTAIAGEGLQADWSISSIQADQHLLRALLEDSDVFLVSNRVGQVVTYAPSNRGDRALLTYQTEGGFASAAPPNQLGNGDIFHLVGNGRYFRISLGLQRPAAGWSRFRSDHRASAR